jgi:hypothetical protein
MVCIREGKRREKQRGPGGRILHRPPRGDHGRGALASEQQQRRALSTFWVRSEVGED